MRSRRQRHDTRAPSHERWLVSYADFITLLFAFFVVMYAISTVNLSKYRAVGEGIGHAFGHERSPSQPTPAPAPEAAPQAPSRIPEAAKAAELARKNREQRMAQVAGRIRSALEPLAQQGNVRLRPTPQGLVVEISASVLFAPAQAVLMPETVGSLQAVALILAEIPNAVNVEGHTDAVPISTPQYPSNWELSSARAGAVVRLFAASGVAASRLAAIGYADQRPVEANDSPDGKARNRRVTLLVLPEALPPAHGDALSPTKGPEARHGGR